MRVCGSMFQISPLLLNTLGRRASRCEIPAAEQFGASFTILHRFFSKLGGIGKTFQDGCMRNPREFKNGGRAESSADQACSQVNKGDCR